MVKEIDKEEGEKELKGGGVCTRLTPRTDLQMTFFLQMGHTPNILVFPNNAIKRLIH